MKSHTHGRSRSGRAGVPASLAAGLLLFGVLLTACGPSQAAQVSPSPETLAAEVSPAAPVPEINESNWQNHPDIVAIREVYKEVEGLVSQDQQLFDEATLDALNSKLASGESPYFDGTGIPGNAHFRFWYNKNSGSDRLYVRKLEIEFEKGGLQVLESHYYDESDTLCFVYVQAADASGSSDLRLYYSNGNRFWENHKTGQGTGADIPKTWPEKYLELDASTMLSKFKMPQEEPQYYGD